MSPAESLSSLSGCLYRAARRSRSLFQSVIWKTKSRRQAAFRFGSSSFWYRLYRAARSFRSCREEPEVLRLGRGPAWLEAGLPFGSRFLADIGQPLLDLLEPGT